MNVCTVYCTKVTFYNEHCNKKVFNLTLVHNPRTKSE